MWNKKGKFTALVKAYSTDLYRYAFWLSGEKGQAEDLVQETFSRAWRAIDSLRDEAAAKSWLITTLRREYFRLFERQRPEIVDTDLENLESLQPDYDTRIEAHVLRNALARLPLEYREPLLLQVLWGYSCSEIAVLFNIKEGAVMTRLSRARQKLRDLLTEESSKSRISAGEKGL